MPQHRPPAALYGGSDSTLRSDLSGGKKVVSLNKWGLLASSSWYIYLQAYCVSSIVNLFISFLGMQ